MNTRGRVIMITDRGATIVMTGYKVAQIARLAGLRPVYNGVAQGWVSDGRKLGDLLAFCQSRNIAVTVTETDGAA
jgi:hypothetical protein